MTQTGPPGVGNAVRQGLAASRGAWVVMIDSDGEMDPQTVPRLLAEQARTGADLVVASRWVRGGGVEGYDAWKLPLNRVFQVLFRVLARAPVHDLTLGFKLLRGDLARTLPWKAERHEIGIETTLRPLCAGARAAEVPTVWRRRKAGRSKGTFLMNFRYVRMALQVMMRPTS
ncbi:MAG: glycosyltransferase [Acidobacteriota bacterium]